MRSPATSAEKATQERSLWGAEAAGAVLPQRLLLLLVGRALVVTVLLGGAIFFQYQGIGRLSAEAHLRTLSPVYGGIIFVYVLSLLYAFIYRFIVDKRDQLRAFAFSQVAVDVLVVSYLVVVSGGARSFLPFLYLLIVVYAGILLASSGAFLAATLGSIIYPFSLFAIGWLPEDFERMALALGTASPTGDEIAYASLVNVSTLFLTAALVSYLAERLRVTGEALARSEIDLRMLESLHREIVTSLSSGIITVDPRREITYLNPAAEEMLGRTLTDVYRLPLEDAFPAVGRAIDDAQSGTGWRRPEVTMKEAGGKLLHLGFSVTPFGEEEAGQEGGQIIIFQDLTQLKRAEERLKQADRLAAIGEMAASIAHEIRNPLASISGSLELLGTDGIDPDGRRLMGVVQREIARLNDLISNFLNYSRPLELKSEEMDLRELVEDVVAAVQRVKGRELSVSINADGDDFRIVADADQLRQVLWNLLVNARNAVADRKGEIQVQIFHTGEHSPSGTCGFSITDNGPGIPVELRRKVFNPFFTTRPDGSGLGLALVDRIVGLHGGEIQLDESPLGGARFTVILPTEPPADLGKPVVSAEVGIS